MILAACFPVKMDSLSQIISGNRNRHRVHIRGIFETMLCIAVVLWSISDIHTISIRIDDRLITTLLCGGLRDLRHLRYGWRVFIVTSLYILLYWKKIAILFYSAIFILVNIIRNLLLNLWSPFIDNLSLKFLVQLLDLLDVLTLITYVDLVVLLVVLFINRFMIH